MPNIPITESHAIKRDSACQARTRLVQPGAVVAFYNEIEPFAADWLTNLSAAGLIASGIVDRRSVELVKPNDLRNCAQAHFFAGIGGWSHALRSAGWPDDEPVWTGSCPCQPFSVAGKQGGFSDVRHLWPAWFRLIRECHPPIIFGEQVASPDGLAWFDAVSSDLEREGYAVGAADLCAASVGAPHIRQRLFFVANAKRRTTEQRGYDLATTKDETQGEVREQRLWHDAWASRNVGRLANSDRQRQLGEHALLRSEGARTRTGALPETSRRGEANNGPCNGFWEGAEWIACLDEKLRAIEPGTFPLAHGVPTRMGRLRAYGNAIVPQVAATFIRAAMTTL